MKERRLREEQRRVFEQLALNRGYDIERSADLYDNHITNDAWSFYEAGRRAQSPVQEVGPWRGGVSAVGKPTLASNDFEHDALVTVDGDFGDPGIALAYAEELARRLNWATGRTLQLRGEVPYEQAELARMALLRIVDKMGVLPKHSSELSVTQLEALALNHIEPQR